MVGVIILIERHSTSAAGQEEGAVANCLILAALWNKGHRTGPRQTWIAMSALLLDGWVTNLDFSFFCKMGCSGSQQLLPSRTTD